MEFQGLVSSPLLEKIRQCWAQADEEIRNLYHAILQRIAYERQQVELVNLPELSGPAATLDTLPEKAELQPLQPEELEELEEARGQRNPTVWTNAQHEMMPAPVIHQPLENQMRL